MVHGFRHLRAAVLGIALCPGLASLVLAQDAADWKEVANWKVEAPPNSVQLVSIEPFTSDSMTFTFKNISERTILEFWVFKQDGNGMDGVGKGMNAFITGAGAIAPGATVAVGFGVRELSGGNQSDRSLRIEAIVYTDGTRVGSKKQLDKIEEEMIGAALETKRDANLLAASPDPSVDGFDAIAEKTARTLQSPAKEIKLDGLMAEEITASVSGIGLSGIPQSYIDAHLNHPDFNFLHGVINARQLFLSNMNQAKSDTTLPATGSQARRELMKQLQSHALADLAQKYSSVCEGQTQVIRAFIAASDPGN